MNGKIITAIQVIKLLAIAAGIALCYYFIKIMAENPVPPEHIYW